MELCCLILIHFIYYVILATPYMPYRVYMKYKQDNVSGAIGEVCGIVFGWCAFLGHQMVILLFVVAPLGNAHESECRQRQQEEETTRQLHTLSSLMTIGMLEACAG